MSIQNIVNLASYKFIVLDDLANLRESLRVNCTTLKISGTILLAHEGINLFVAGERSSIDALKQDLIQRFGPFPFKESFSSYQPFKRMLVKIKKEIIAMGVEHTDPEQKPAPYVQAQELKKWLDEGRDVVILDTRNDYEMRIGKFKNAKELDLKTFRQFPNEVQKLDPALKKRTIVTYCTGGIRCEKAATYMINEGFEDVYQLDGGILKYFEECGGAHYEGDCFVFDQRVALDPNLEKTQAVQCFACRMPVLPMEQASAQYKVEEYCPHCFEKNGKAAAA